MSKLITREQVAAHARVVDAPERQPTTVDRTFGLPVGLYGATGACYLGFLAILAVCFGNPGLIIPMAIFVLFIAAGFGLPAIWATMKPDTSSRSLTWGAFRRDGVTTATGRLPARDVAIQVLILPVLIVLWGIAVVTIAALVV